MRGYGHTPYFVEGHEPEKVHQQMAETLDKVVAETKGLVLDGKLVANFEDQLDPRDIDLVEDPGSVLPLRQYPAIFYPMN